MRSREFVIDGMSCIACQNKIDRKLNKTKGIQTTTVSYETGKAFVEFDPEIISFSEIEKIINDLGYSVQSEHNASKPDIGVTISLSMIVIALFVLLRQSGLLNLLVPSHLAESGMSYGMLFVVGLLTSVHCIAMCGGINLSQCISRSGNSGKPSLWNSFLYNSGRVLSYTVIGFILGGIGMLFGIGNTGFSAFLQGMIKLIAGLLMVIMGVNMLGIFPVLRKLQPRLPKSIAAKVNRQKAVSTQPFLVGVLNGLMPCGPLQSMQIFALASGNPFTGALSMLLFSLGTVPLMLGIGTIISALGKRFSQTVMQIGAVLVAVMGLSMLLQGGNLSGIFNFETLLIVIISLTVMGIIITVPFNKKIYRLTGIAAAAAIFIAGTFIMSRTSMQTNNSDKARISDGIQTVSSTLSSGRYPNITVQSGIPVKWTINAPQGSINGCNNQILIREYNIVYSFTEGENVITFTPTETGTFSYNCWMGMIEGTIQVI